MLKIKQEPSAEEVEQILEQFRQELPECKDLSSLQRSFVHAVQHLTPAADIRLLVRKGDRLIAPDGEMSLPVDGGRGLVQRSINQREALLTNDVNRDDRYDAGSDNPESYPLKSLLVFPFFQSNQTLTAVLWAAIPFKDLNQFVSRDLERLKSTVSPVLQCLEQLNESKTDSVSAAEEEPVSSSQESTGLKEGPALIDAIKSWFGSRKKQ